jgi:hypothetical protein
MNTITARNETEALLLEKFQSLLADLDTAGDNAQYGHVRDDMDDLGCAFRKTERIGRNASQSTSEARRFRILWSS